jgi:hypothetical protein
MIGKKQGRKRMIGSAVRVEPESEGIRNQSHPVNPIRPEMP